MIDQLRWRLALHFGLLSIFSALLIGLGQKSMNLPMLMIVTVGGSFLMVDTLGWFSLHRYLAYAGMIGGAIMALYDFFGDQTVNQLYSIASLLFYAQIVLFLQKKNRRIFEQLGIFLLLQLIVAALVNDDVLFGILLLPILALGLSTLALFTYYVASGAEGHDFIKDRFSWRNVLANLVPEILRRPTAAAHQEIHLQAKPAPQWKRQIDHLPWLNQVIPLGITTLTFASLFFYLLPRTNDSSYESAGGAKPIVGFSDSLQLDQFGEILRSDDLVMRVSFRDMKKGGNYNLERAPYLRGVSLEDYEGRRSRTGTWSQRRMLNNAPVRALPTENLVRPEHRANGDRVAVRFSIEKSEMASLFCIAPSFALSSEGFTPNFIPEDWRLFTQRNFSEGMRSKINYTLGTNQFRNGKEILLVPEAIEYFAPNVQVASTAKTLDSVRRVALTRFEAQRFPGLIALTERIVGKLPKDSKGPGENPVRDAMMLENYLATTKEFSYTLDLSMDRNVELDPIEDFVVNQKSGHCQYFASTLAMMLRSRGIPARIIAGYRPSEYNELGDYFVVKQHDAHSWVEAYFDQEQLAKSNLFRASDTTQGGWLRLDPTPATDISNSSGALNRQRGVDDYFQDIWNRNVLELNQDDQEGGIYDAMAGSGTYADAIRTLQMWAIQAQEKDFAAGLLAPGRWFSLPVATWVIGLGSVLAVMWWTMGLRLARWIPSSWRIQRSQSSGSKTSIRFYHRCLSLLARLGIRRQPWQTPREATQEAARWLGEEHRLPEARPLLENLTDAYYQLRFGGVSELGESQKEKIESDLQTLERTTKSIQPKRK